MSKLGERIAVKMREGMDAAAAAEAARAELAEEAKHEEGPLVVNLRLKPLHRRWLEAKCAAYGVTIDAYVSKAIGELWQRDEWRREQEQPAPGHGPVTIMRSHFKGGE